MDETMVIEPPYWSNHRSTIKFHFKSIWIDVAERILKPVAVRVDPPAQSNRITLDISPNPRIVIPEVVVMEVGFLVEVNVVR